MSRENKRLRQLLGEIQEKVNNAILNESPQENEHPGVDAFKGENNV